MSTGSRIAIGKIRRPHGLGGAFKVLSFSGEYDHFALPKVYHLKNGNRFRDFEVEWVKLSGALTLVKLKGLDTPEQVRLYSNWEIYVDRTFAAPLNGTEEFYYADLIGMKAVCGGTVRGTVTALYQDLPDDTLEITITETGKKVLVPFRSLFVGDVNPAEGTVTVLEEWFFQ